jgi:hypothetical protein
MRKRDGSCAAPSKNSVDIQILHLLYGRREPMQQTYVVRFARDDPETPPTMDEQIALARKAAQKLGVPNAESKRCTESVGTPIPARPGLTSSGPRRVYGRSRSVASTWTEHLIGRPSLVTRLII